MAGQADTARSQNSFGADVDRWRQAIREDTFSNYHYEMGVALRRQGDTAAAVAAFRRALDIAPDLAKASLALIETLDQMGQSDEARAARDEASARDPDFELAANLARIEDATKCEDNDLSVATVVAVHHRAPHLVRPLVLAARAFRNAGRYDEAAEWSAKAMALNVQEAFLCELEFFSTNVAGNQVRHLSDRISVTTDAEAGKYAAGFFFGRPTQEMGLLIVTIRLRVLRGRIMLGVTAKGGTPFFRSTVEPSADIVSINLPVLADAGFGQMEIYNSARTGEASEFEIHGVEVHRHPLPSAGADTGASGDAAMLQRQIFAATALRMAGRYGEARRYLETLPAGARLGAARYNLHLLSATPSGHVEDRGEYRLISAIEGDFVYAVSVGLGQPARLPCTVIITVFLRVLKGLAGVRVVSSSPSSQGNRLFAHVPVGPSADVVAVELRVEAAADFGELVILASAPAHPSELPAEIELHGFLVE